MTWVLFSSLMTASFHISAGAPRGGKQQERSSNINSGTEGDGLAHVLHFGGVPPVLAQPTDHHRAQSATTPPDGVHEAGGSSPGPRLDDIENRGKNIGIVKALAQAEEAHHQ